jgi:hypothetical protein
MAQIRFEYCRKACRFAPQGRFEVKYAPILPKILADISKIEVIMPQITVENFCQKCIVCRLIWMSYSNAVD